MSRTVSGVHPVTDGDALPLTRELTRRPLDAELAIAQTHKG